MNVMEKFFLDRNSAALVVIDVQEKLCRAMDSVILSKLTGNIAILLETAEALTIPVLVTEQYTRGLGETVPELRQKLPVPAMEKMSFSCCGDQAFLDRLTDLQRPQVIITGMETHVCVLQTVIDLLDAGFEVHVVKDAVMSRSNDNRQTAIEAMVLAGAVPTCTEAVVFQLLKIAGTESFKKLSKLVK